MKPDIGKILFFCLLFSFFAEGSENFSDYFVRESQVHLQTKSLKIGSMTDFAISLDNDFIFVDAIGKKVIVFDNRGNFKKFIGRIGEGPGEFQLPKSIAIDREGKIYIADNDARRINIYDRNGEFLNSFIITGLHWVPYIMKIDSLGNIYMGGYKEDFEHPFTGTWIHKYSLEGKYIKSFFPTNKIARGKVMAYYSHCSFDIGLDNFLYAIQATEYKIYKYDLEGRLIRTFGNPSPYYVKPKGFPSAQKWRLLSDKAKEELLNSWTHISKLLLVKNRYILIILEIRPQHKFVIDIYDKNGNMVAGVETNFKPLCKDNKDNLYFLVYTDEVEPIKEEPQYIIGKYSLRLDYP